MELICKLLKTLIFGLGWILIIFIPRGIDGDMLMTVRQDIVAGES